MRMRVRNVYLRVLARGAKIFLLGLCPKRKMSRTSGNHFYEMKGDVGMSLHEKERNKKMPTPRHKVTHNPIPTLFFFQDHNVTYFAGNWMSRCFAVSFALPNAFITNKQTNNMLKQNKDVGMGL